MMTAHKKVKENMYLQDTTPTEARENSTYTNIERSLLAFPLDIEQQHYCALLLSAGKKKNVTASNCTNIKLASMAALAEFLSMGFSKGLSFAHVKPWRAPNKSDRRIPGFRRCT